MNQIVDLDHKGNISGAVDAELVEHANEIRKLRKCATSDIIEIGKHLIVAKALAGHGNWLPWLEREFGWKEQSARNFMNVAEMAAKSPTVGDLDIDFRGLYLLAAPSTPPEVIQGVAALGRKVTAKDIVKAKAAHKSNRAPVAPKSRSIKTTPAPDPIEILAGKIFDEYADDGKYRLLPRIAAAFKVAPTAVRDALESLGGCVIYRKPNGQMEYKIVRDTEADLRAMLVTKDGEIAKLKAKVAELEADVERLTAPTARAMVG